jgi:hypothetical protein
VANACIAVGHWPTYFKESNSVIIPKPGKAHYTMPKMFRPIVLLNTIGKLFEKMLANRLQFKAAEQGVLHLRQFGGVQQHSTKDVL